MRYFCMAFILGLSSTIANAQAVQSAKPVICDSTAVILTALKEKFAETPVWIGKGQETGYLLLVNKESKTWTFLQYTNEIACILGAGVKANGLGELQT